MQDKQGKQTDMITDVNKAQEQSLHLFVVLSRAFNWTSAHVQKDIREYRLNPTEFGVLELLFHKGRQPLQQIGDKILISSGNITYVVDKLEKKGYLLRKPCPNDRRVIYAELTQEGEQFLQEIFPKHREKLAEAMSGLSPEEKEITITLLKKLGKSAEMNFVDK
ncbi:MarR family transcriptional regulator [Brevibacillus halotolerans]|uniref:MarR family winged helix-turn-helix transcriptional regulator n=1 Tax=Brevibacillus TaxID=55080 RepID=UPI00215BA943|nr:MULTISPECIES: MarR family transcriptional regulator [Brevibacillus]MCR8962846.1 MarR family transcriptional regulator [Brevibacillus laterosporus]MCZ0835001.1 MarR family transcriptional regulator [Brevibacillus halotolerans]